MKKIVTALNNFLHKAKQEAAKEYSVAATVKGDGVSSGSKGQENAKKGWVGIDLDGTLARVDTLSDISKIGEPIPKMVNLATRLTKDGVVVKIFTARASDPRQVPMIQKWLRDNGLPVFEVTNVKDFDMIRVYDDRAVQVIANTGEIVEAVGVNSNNPPDE